MSDTCGMSLELIDTHCHLGLEPIAPALEAVLSRARDAGVQACVSIGTTLEDSRANVVLAQRHAMVRAAVGVHPNDTAGLTEETIAAVEALAQEPGVVAIGEVGLDFYRQRASPDDQRLAFRAFIAMAQRHCLPLAIHCRQAYEELIAVLRQEAAPPIAGIIHCASGPPDFIEAALALGLHVSFAGNVTFPNAQALRALVGLVPDERLLIETDAPFLAPQPVRGRPNEPAYVAQTAVCLAQLRGTTAEALGALTAGNARRLFQLNKA